MLHEALEAHRAGLAVVPVREDGSKAPDLDSWTQYQEAPPSEDEAGVPFLWTEARQGGRDRLFIVRPTGNIAGSGETDRALLSIEVPVQYEISDLIKYTLLAADFDNPDDPDRLRPLAAATPAPR